MEPVTNQIATQVSESLHTVISTMEESYIVDKSQLPRKSGI